MKRLALFLLSGLCGVTFAAPEDITFQGNLLAPPACTVSANNTIDVLFQDVIIDNINGVNFRQDVPYTITCDSASRNSAWVMTLTWTGSQTDFDNAAVQTNVTGLGIQLQQNGQPFRWNTPLTIDTTNLPTLKAVPVKKNGAVLNDGDFSAYATLQVDYQ
ncbi:fimbrial protein [Escherichia albertii]|uniref:Fimbrial protein n=2 Tax=Escherichia albertii TaxID=208962 RepID=A0A7U8WEF6_ESCAL|nr:fimbrial protein [Escherichia albertii]AHE61478.1 fimbrial subunit [Escherichia albertii KF1]EDS92896.1 fimbrial subunit [Escherichia albertii TW07627]EEW0112445.1 fimbrial protein [Escherichia albertii]EEW7495967.1 fimbrial protein [Escherichia albertii]EEX4920994.1 fimbrial protein [Escherichia albertii]